MVQVVRQYQAYHVKAQKDYSAAVEELVSISKEFEQMDEIERALYTTSRVLILCVEHEDLDSPHKCMELADRLKSQLGSDEGIYTAYYFLAKARHYLLKNQHEKCIQHASKSCDLYARMGKNAYK